MSGVKLSGKIKSFDKYSVVLETNNQEQLIFKHAISTVVVSQPFHSPAHSSAAAGSHAAPGAPRAHHLTSGISPGKQSRLADGNRAIWSGWS